ncbi:thiamine pyrophosphate-requiring protein [Lysinibacillus sp. BW-2-10]|uniref:thiamine pyrophosphate-requiring protein n=1 Tax=Lysinibacillus sp. BW-2-10 TaxID=2590030 RepID=UPI0011808F49|nr:thiamine pyrophosphate-requiring protein [Lysinibacillus sp. BW-2-10]TSI09300.1 thiamine pyrophosphate-requiring protein [Lysinibacillus sp. BW-2-10]
MNIQANEIVLDKEDKILHRKYTGASALMDALEEAGVSCIFANLGSDHPAIIENWAQSTVDNKEIPDIIICPHEFVAISAAHGYAQVSGKPQAVFVHVECGTQNLGGGVHNAAVGKVPMLIFAGTSPFTQEGELTGSRNEFIHWLQDVSDQRGIVREYMKYDNELRTGKNIKQIVHRALQISQSEPKGPVYLMAAREVLEEEVEPVSINLKGWGAVTPSAVHPEKIAEIGNALLEAKKPLIITSFLGRNKDAVNELVTFADQLAIPVIESAPNYLNFPADHPLHLGYQWNTPSQNKTLAEADLILILDSDVPWIPMINKPSETSKIFYIDEDPLKERIPLWYIPSDSFIKADSFTALQQLNDWLSKVKIDKNVVKKRFKEVSQVHFDQRNEWKAQEVIQDEDTITSAYLLASLRELIDDDTIILNESITNYENACKHLSRNVPGTYLGSGASSLGWNGGAAIGAKLAAPDKTIVSLTGDGTYMFSNPTPVHWVSKKYNAPFLTIVFNNKGWGAPRMSTLGVHPNGIANETDQFWVNFDPTVEYAKVAEAAGGAFARKVQKPSELKAALKQGLEIVKSGQSVVLDVCIPQISEQEL